MTAVDEMTTVGTPPSAREDSPVGRGCYVRGGDSTGPLGVIVDYQDGSYVVREASGVVRSLTEGVAPLARPGERVEMLREGMPIAGVWLGHDVTWGLVFLFDDARGEVVSWAPTAADVASIVCWPAEGETSERLARAVVRQIRHLESEQRKWDALVSSAHEWADDHDLCGNFDDFMEEHGLPRREREYSVSLDVVVRLDVEVLASSEQRAHEEVTSGSIDIEQEVRHGNGSVSNVEIVD